MLPYQPQQAAVAVRIERRYVNVLVLLPSTITYIRQTETHMIDKTLLVALTVLLC